MQIRTMPKKPAEISESDYFICENQGDLFQLAESMEFDEDDFIRQYMNSRFCNKEMDTPYSYFQMADPEDAMDYILKEIKPEHNNRHYDRNKIYWIGYMYRYLHIRFGINSSVIYQILPLKDMLVYYIGMHTQDDEYFIDIIKDKFKQEGYE